MTVSLEAIPSRMTAVTPSDTTELRGAALYIGGAGNVALANSAGDTVTFTGVLAGSVLPVQFTKVLATGTTATNLVRLY